MDEGPAMVAQTRTIQTKYGPGPPTLVLGERVDERDEDRAEAPSNNLNLLSFLRTTAPPKYRDELVEIALRILPPSAEDTMTGWDAQIAASVCAICGQPASVRRLRSSPDPFGTGRPIIEAAFRCQGHRETDIGRRPYS